MTLKTKKFLTLLLSVACVVCMFLSVGVLFNNKAQAQQNDLNDIIEKYKSYI